MQSAPRCSSCAHAIRAWPSTSYPATAVRECGWRPAMLQFAVARADLHVGSRRERVVRVRVLSSVEAEANAAAEQQQKQQTPVDQRHRVCLWGAVDDGMRDASQARRMPAYNLMDLAMDQDTHPAPSAPQPPPSPPWPPPPAAAPPKPTSICSPCPSVTVKPHRRATPPRRILC